MKADIAEAKAVLNKEKKTAKAKAAKPGDGDAGASEAFSKGWDPLQVQYNLNPLINPQTLNRYTPKL